MIGAGTKPIIVKRAGTLDDTSQYQINDNHNYDTKQRNSVQIIRYTAHNVDRKLERKTQCFPGNICYFRGKWLSTTKNLRKYTPNDQQRHCRNQLISYAWIIHTHPPHVHNIHHCPSMHRWCRNTHTRWNTQAYAHTKGYKRLHTTPHTQQTTRIHTLSNSHYSLCTRTDHSTHNTVDHQQQLCTHWQRMKTTSTLLDTQGSWMVLIRDPLLKARVETDFITKKVTGPNPPLIQLTHYWVRLHSTTEGQTRIHEIASMQF